MSFTATVENGAIRLPPGVELPDGTKVSIEPVEAPQEPSFGEIFAKYAGIVQDGPTDLADNHDHYLYGLPKRVP